MMGGKLTTWLLAASLLAQLGCEEDKPIPEKRDQVEDLSPAPAEPEPPQSPPHLTITESGPSVRGSSAMLTRPDGQTDVQGRGKLASYLSEERKFIEGSEVRLVVDRGAKPIWVSIFMTELSKLSPKKVTIATETRSEFPKEIEFVAQEALDRPDPCTLVGTITEDRGTAIWRLSGGAARKRGRGMGGPDLSMTADTIVSMKKGCDSDIFFATGAEGVEWGLVYDLAASAVALDKVDIRRAVVPIKTATAGHAIGL